MILHVTPEPAHLIGSICLPERLQELKRAEKKNHFPKCAFPTLRIQKKLFFKSSKWPRKSADLIVMGTHGQQVGSSFEA
jgi:hypothetical protein